MNFFERNRRQLHERGIDLARLPPGQYGTDRFPVLHVGDGPVYGPGEWDLRLFGLVEHELRLDEDALRALPSTTITTDIHCVTKWSRFDTSWTGVATRELLAEVGVDAAATHVVAHADPEYTTNLPLEALLRGSSLVAYAYGGAPIAPEHGGPVRLVVPHLYFWKSAKWLRGLELVAGDRPGFWEQNGYHNEGDPWKEQRYWGD